MFSQTYIEHVPEYRKFQGIRTGYTFCKSYKEALLSLFQLNNELMNSWTMITAMIFSYLMHSQRIVNTNIATIQLTSAIFIHSPCSIAFHTFLSVSEKDYYYWKYIDKCGIFIAAILIQVSLSWYLIPIRVIILDTSICLYIFYKFAWNIKYKEISKHREAGLIAIAAGFYHIPILYSVILDLCEINTMRLYYSASISTSLFIGGCVYVYGFPQNYIFVNSGFFDIFGNSHTLMHIMLIFAQYYCFMFIEQSRNIRN